MNQVSFRFYAGLNDFLPAGRQQRTFVYAFEHRASIKDMIESLGVPHTEVELILVDGEAVDFSYLVQDGDRVSVYPIFQSIDISPLVRVRPELPEEVRFILDAHLGRLAGYLRMLGFDTLYRNDYHDEELARLSGSDQRVLLTRDRGLLKRSLVTYGYYVRETDPRQQVVEILGHFDLFGAIAPFRRCIRCNGMLQTVRKEAIRDQLAPKTQQHHDEFRVCEACGQIYWKGSHHERMRTFIESVLESGAGS